MAQSSQSLHGRNSSRRRLKTSADLAGSPLSAILLQGSACSITICVCSTSGQVTQLAAGDVAVNGDEEDDQRRGNDWCANIKRVYTFAYTWVGVRVC